MSSSAPRIAVYSGTFDPFTLGHADVVRRSMGLFDRLIVAVAVAHHKKTLFSLEQRVSQVMQGCQGLGDVQALPFEGLIMDFCAAHQACAANLQCISSTLVREISKLGGDVSQMVSPAIAQDLRAAQAPSA